MTKIEWTDTTDNPIKVVGGGYWCQKVSEGCANCYAEKLNQNSFFKGNGLKYSGQTPQFYLDYEILKSWSRMRKSKKHFVGSMTDIFGEWVPIEWQIKILEAAWEGRKTNQIYQFLTKRPAIAVAPCLQFINDWDLPHIPDNIWLGVSIESKENIGRSRCLAQIPGNKFWSIEPLLEDLGDISERLINDQVSWVIIGGESGASARKCDIDWILSIIAQCKELSIPVFVKQLGRNTVRKWMKGSHYLGDICLNLSDRKGGDWDEWEQELRVRETPKQN